MAEMIRYTNIPFSKCDCFDLLKRVYKQELGIDIGEFTDRDFPEKWHELPKTGLHKLKKYCVLTMKLPKARLMHVAVSAGGGRMLHTIEGKQSMISRIDQYRRWILGVYEWRG